jgi:hypothetical protein
LVFAPQYSVGGDIYCIPTLNKVPTQTKQPGKTHTNSNIQLGYGIYVVGTALHNTKGRDKATFIALFAKYLGKHVAV